MIVKMVKLLIASSRDDRDRLLVALRDLGMVHLIPVDPESAVADESTRAQLDIVGRAVQQLQQYEPAGQAPDITPEQAAARTLVIFRRSVEDQNRLTALYRHIRQLEIWGDLRLGDLDAIKQAGVDPTFYLVPTNELSEIQAEFVCPLAGAEDKSQTLVAVIDRDGQDQKLPAAAELLELPARDRPTLRAEAGEIDANLKAGEEELAKLANLLPAIEAEHDKLQSHAEFVAAANSGLHAEQLYAVQGWVPKKQVDALAEGINAAGLSAAVEQLPPTEEDQPPTLVEYAWWARPIKALFAILGTTPGYREYDLAPFFMIAMPIFTAMLVGDAGYGLIFALVGVLFYGKLKKLTKSAAAPQLILVFGLATMAWGILTANYFGITPDAVAGMGGFASVRAMQAGQGFCAIIGSMMTGVGVLWRSDPEAARNIVMKISFILACVQLVTAHMRQALALLPGLKGLAELGWCAFLVGMFGLVWALFFPSPVMPPIVMQCLLIGGGGTVVVFSYPSKNPLKMLGLGLVANLMPMIGTFSDTMSYIRLMAVGLASFYIASAFNGLAVDVAKVSPVLILASVVILLAAHALNIILCLIAIFAHGVRLNMLEFSNNAGVQWTGHPYAPFAARKIEKTLEREY